MQSKTQTIIEVIEKSCQKHSNKLALQQKDQGEWVGLSYCDLQLTYESIAGGLISSGFNRGDHAAIIAPSSPRWVATYLGILRSGGVTVPIDKELKSSELRHILEDSDTQYLFTTKNYLEVLQDIVGELSFLKRIVLLDEDPLVSTKCSALPKTLTAIAEKWKEIASDANISTELQESFNVLLAAAQSEAGGVISNFGTNSTKTTPLSENQQITKLIDSGVLVNFSDFKEEVDLPAYTETADATAVILYTSGTTGRSKGAMLSHGNITTNIESAIDRFELRTKQVNALSFLPINHVFEQVCGIMLPLSLGGTVYFAESLKKLGENLKEVKPTFFLGVPAVYRLLSDRILKSINSKRLSRTLFALPVVKNIVTAKVQKSIGKEAILVSGGAALDPAVSRTFSEFGLQLFQGYGITETSPVISAESFTQKKPGTVGLPLDGVSVRIDSPNEEGIGEIWASGPNIMQGYYKNQRATDEVLEDGWYKTGDLGFIDSDGFITISGRVKNLIVTPNGKNVYPEEIEAELLNSPFIAEVMVYGHKIDSSSEEVHAAIFPNQEHLDNYARDNNLPQLNQTEVNEIIKKEVLNSSKMLADYKRIKKFTLREDEFPKTTTRKIKRFAVGADVLTDA